MINFLQVGDKVVMMNGEILTIKSLNETTFSAEEKTGNFLKDSIDNIFSDDEEYDDEFQSRDSGL
jgi:preprotein translocase subunit YajC